jgi:hypothetical protein
LIAYSIYSFFSLNTREDQVLKKIISSFNLKISIFLNNLGQL